MNQITNVLALARRALARGGSAVGSALSRAAGLLFFLVVSGGFLAIFQATYGDRNQPPMVPGLIALCLAVFFAFALYRFSLVLFGQAVRGSRDSFVRLVSADPAETSSQSAADSDPAQPPRTAGSTEEYLGVLQRKVADVQRSLEARSAKCSALGRQFAAAALLIPVVTWVVALVVFRGEKLTNLWALTFSSMTAGSIAIAVGVAFMKHAVHLSVEAAQARSEYLHAVALELAVSIGSREGLQKEAVALVLSQLVCPPTDGHGRSGARGRSPAIEGVDHNVLLETANQLLNPKKTG